jgi:two-component system, LytTR family, response regulator LytT
MNIVIIEDEKVTAKDLQRTILAFEPDATVKATLHSVEDAIDYFKKNDDTDLIFSDIQLGDGLSFEIFKRMDNHPPIIFCTAYDHYFTEAFDSLGIDYIMKPFNKAAIEKALSKYVSLKQQFSRNVNSQKSQLDLLESRLNNKRSAVIIRQREKIIPLDVVNIALFFINNGYTFAYTFKNEKFILNENLDALEHLFSPAFFRTNRQFLVNRRAVKDATHFFNRKVLVNLTIPFKEQILVGKLKITEFVDWLGHQ